MSQNSRFAVAVHSAGMIAFGDRMVVTSEAIARSVGTNPVVVRRVCGMLVKAGLVEVKKGQNGGALLTRPAEKITLGEIYRAVEQETVLPVPELSGKHPCAIGKRVGPVLRVFFGRAENCMLKQLDRTRLSDVIAAVQEKKK